MWWFFFFSFSIHLSNFCVSMDWTWVMLLGLSSRSLWFYFFFNVILYYVRQVIPSRPLSPPSPPINSYLPPSSPGGQGDHVCFSYFMILCFFPYPLLGIKECLFILQYRSIFIFLSVCLCLCQFFHIQQHHHEPGMPFDFAYSVSDYPTQNQQSHKATSDGDVTRGEYRVQLPDGRTQVVRYTADWKNGYNAEVQSK